MTLHHYVNDAIWNIRLIIYQIYLNIFDNLTMIFSITMKTDKFVLTSLLGETLPKTLDCKNSSCLSKQTVEMLLFKEIVGK